MSLPQLDWYWFPTQIFWVTFSFVAFLFVSKIFVKNIFHSIFDRNNNLGNMKNKIIKIENEYSEIKKKIEEYDQSISSMFDHAMFNIRQELSQEHDEKIKEFLDSRRVEKKKSDHEFVQWKSKLLSDIKPYILKISEEMVNKICR